METMVLMSQIFGLVAFVMTIAAGIWGMITLHKLTAARHALLQCTNTQEERRIRVIGGRLKREYNEARILFFFCLDFATGIALFLVRTNGYV